MSKISVIVPVYNIENYVERCVNSLTAQSFGDLEIILVDDGSKDSSGDRCDALAAKDSRIRVVHKENGGLSSARNAGMDVATGEYISFIDGDDYIDTDMYEKLIAVTADAPDIVRFGYYEVCEGRVVKRWAQDYAEGLYTGEKLRELKLDAVYFPNVLDYGRDRIPSAWAGLYRRDFLEENQLRFRSEREILNEDYLFMVQVMVPAKSVYIHPHPYYRYDTRDGSLSRTYPPRIYERKQALFAAYCELVPMDDPEMAVRLDNFYIDCIYDCFVRECTRADSRKQAISRIRILFRDERLQQALRRNKERVTSAKTKVICLLMRRRMARMAYAMYNMVRVLKK